MTNRRDSSEYKNLRSFNHQPIEASEEENTKNQNANSSSYNYGNYDRNGEEAAINNNNEIFMMTFDYYKNYSNYFVHNNPDNVILKMALKFRQKSKIFAKKRGAISFGNNIVEVSSPKKSRSILMKRLSHKKSFFHSDFMN